MRESVSLHTMHCQLLISPGIFQYACFILKHQVCMVLMMKVALVEVFESMITQASCDSKVCATHYRVSILHRHPIVFELRSVLPPLETCRYTWRRSGGDINSPSVSVRYEQTSSTSSKPPCQVQVFLRLSRVSGKWFSREINSQDHHDCRPPGIRSGCWAGHLHNLLPFLDQAPHWAIS